MPYLTYAELVSRSAYSQDEWDEFCARQGRETTFDDWLSDTQSDIEDPLRLRYDTVAIATDPPRCVKKWQARLLDELFLTAQLKPGQIAEDSDISASAARTRQEIADAADQDKPAHRELPLLSGGAGSGVAKGLPMSIGFNTVHGYFDDLDRRRNEGGW